MKEPRRLFRHRPRVDHATLFRKAMDDVTAEDRTGRLAAMQLLARITYGEDLAPFDFVYLAAMDCLLERPPWPCAGCGAQCRGLVSWLPNRGSLGRDFGCAPSAAAVVFYPICAGCDGRCTRGEASWKDAVEVNVLASLRSMGAIPVGS
jgi:hypothetical protein